MSHELIVAPSVLSADFSCLRQGVELIHRSPAQWIHWDVMDGSFVPNITFGMPVIKALRPYSDKVFDVHLMIDRPEQYIEAFARAGADRITVHYEATRHLHRLVQQIHKAGAKAGVAINPATPVACIEDIVPYADLILIMSVNPGFGGQSFIGRSLDKIGRTRELIERLNPSCLLEVDGGINSQTAPQAVRAGAHVLVAGSYVFGSQDPLDAIQSLFNAR